jgi:3-oxoacyl-[acyl-carrier protein] reductase
MINLSNKVAIVTGSGRGIGRAISLSLARCGASVVINDIGAAAEETAAELREQGLNSIAVTADISQPADVAHLVDATLDTYGRLDILVNNAGITRDQLLLRMSDDDWSRVIAVNLSSVFLCTRAAIKPMIKQRCGRIISLASIVGLIGNAGQSNYSAAKAGIIGFTKSVAREVASRGITANAIAPGFIDTDMTRKLSDDQRQELTSRIPAGRLGAPEDVAAAVLFLSSEEAGYITGQVLVVDGGMTMA